MSRTFAASILISIGTSVGLAQTPIVRARLEPSNGIIVGQTVHLVVEVLVPNYFTGSPDFPEFEVSTTRLWFCRKRELRTPMRR